MGPAFSRSRWLLGLLVVATMAAGLATRAFPDWFPAPIARYGGDALWATLVYWLGASLRPRGPTMAIGASALTVATLVELSQLSTAPWLESIRRTPAGALVLGRGFLASDLVSYGVGVVLAAALDLAWIGRRRRG